MVIGLVWWFGLKAWCGDGDVEVVCGKVLKVKGGGEKQNLNKQTLKITTTTMRNN